MRRARSRSPDKVDRLLGVLARTKAALEAPDLASEPRFLAVLAEEVTESARPLISRKKKKATIQ